MKKEKTKGVMFLAIAAAFALLSTAAFAIPGLLDFAHGIMQYFIGGNSNGKLIVFTMFMTLLPLACFAALNSGISERLEKKQALLFKLFAVFSMIIFAFGILQFDYFSLDYGNATAFATLYHGEKFSNWEASKMSHNHFSKASLFLVSSALGLEIGRGSFDDGMPFYNVIPFSWAWGLAFLALLALLIVFGAAHAISRSKTIGVFDFVVFSLGMLSIIIHSLDGGIATETFAFGLFFITLYYFRQFIKEKTGFYRLLPLAFALVFISFIEAFSGASVWNLFNQAPLLSIGLAYFFIGEVLDKRLFEKWPSKVILLAVLTLSISSSVLILDNFTQGRTVLDFSKNPSLTSFLEGDVLFIYGIPQNAEDSAIREEIAKFGSVEEFDRKGWVAYARIIPEKPFRSMLLEKALSEKLKPEGYFYVEDVFPAENYQEYSIFILSNKEPRKLDEKFLGVTLVSQEYDEKTRSIKIVLKSTYTPNWTMLAVLEEGYLSGMKEQVLLVK